jgi:hypothetical protein
VIGHGLGFCHVSRGIGLGVLLRQWMRMHHDNAPRLLSDAAIAVVDLSLAAHTVATPARGGLVLRPPGVLHQPGPGGVRAPPSVACLPDSTRARDERDALDLVLKTYTQATTPRGLTIRDAATPPGHTSGQALRDGAGGPSSPCGCHRVAGMMPLQHREAPGFDSAPTREPVGRMGRDEAVDPGGARQTP